MSGKSMEMYSFQKMFFLRAHVFEICMYINSFSIRYVRLNGIRT